MCGGPVDGEGGSKWMTGDQSQRCAVGSCREVLMSVRESMEECDLEDGHGEEAGVRSMVEQYKRRGYGGAVHEVGGRSGGWEVRGIVDVGYGSR